MPFIFSIRLSDIGPMDGWGILIPTRGTSLWSLRETESVNRRNQQDLPVGRDSLDRASETDILLT
jgi:hypothetical protein